MGGVIPVGAANGQTVYAQILSAIDAGVANGVGLEAYNQAHYTNYTISSIENLGANRYIITVPGYLPAGRYICMPYLALTPGTPAPGDTPLDMVFFDWDGGNIVWLGSGVNISKINGSAPAAANLSVSAIAMVPGAAAAGTLTTQQMTTNLTAPVAMTYAGRLLIFTSGVNAGFVALITAYAVTGGRLTFIGYNNQPMPSAPAALDTFIIK